jgi:hypothetical protein
MSTEFPANSLLLNEIFEFWAEFDDFETESEKFPVFYPVLSILTTSSHLLHRTLRPLHVQNLPVS